MSSSRRRKTPSPGLSTTYRPASKAQSIPPANQSSPKKGKKQSVQIRALKLCQQENEEMAAALDNEDCSDDTSPSPKKLPKKSNKSSRETGTET